MLLRCSARAVAWGGHDCGSQGVSMGRGGATACDLIVVVVVRVCVCVVCVCVWVGATFSVRGLSLSGS